MSCGPAHFRAGTNFRLAVFIGVLGGIPAFGHRRHAGPVVLSLVLALIEFAEESRRKSLKTQALLGRTYSTIRALMDVSHLLDGLNDDQRQAVALPWRGPGFGRRRQR